MSSVFLNYLGAGIEGLGSVMEGYARSAGYASSAEGARLAAEEIERGAKAESAQIARQRSEMVGAMANRFAVAGVAIEGSAMESLLEAARQITMEKLMKARNARAQAYGQHLNEIAYKKAAKAAKKAGFVGMAGAALGALL